MTSTTKSNVAARSFDAKEREEICARYNVGNVLRHLAGDRVDIGFETDISAEAIRRETGGKQTISRHGGIYVPSFCFASRTMMGKTNVAGHIAGNGAALVATDLLADELVNPLEARLILSKLGVRYLDGLQGDVAIPKSDSVSAYWIGAEDADATSVTPSFSQLTASPHCVGAYVDVSRKLAIQSSLVVQNFIGDLILRSVARAIETAALNGSGTNGEPTGLLNTTGINSISGITAGAPTRADILAFEAAVETANADTDAMAWLMPSAVKAALKNVAIINTTTDEDSSTTVNVGVRHLLEDGKMEGYPAFMSNIAPAKKLILGDFSQMMICSWSNGFELAADQYSLSKSGAIRIVALHDCDIVVRNAEAFAVGTILA